MKKILYVLIPIVLILLFAILIFKPFSKDDSDSIRFKNEYEELNNKVNEQNSKKYREIKIPNDNPFVYKSAEEISEMIDNKESFIVYFGFNSCPWCRSVLPTLIEVLKDLKIKEIYYVDVKDIRDTIVLNKEGNLKTTKEGSSGYKKLIQLLKDVLEDYTLTDSDGNIVKTGESRIYAPNVIKVENGKGVKIATGVSELQTDGYMELTDEMIDDTYHEFEEILR